MFREVADRFWDVVPNLASLWFRPEADDIIDLRFELQDDSWDARGDVIEKILAEKRQLQDVYVNFSFVLPDEAYTMSASEKAEQRIHSFA